MATTTTTTTRPRARKSAEERAAEVAALTDRLAGAVESLAESEQWRAMLRFTARFHAYSPRNVWLLMMQAQERGTSLSRVAGFGTWKSLGYAVRKGERSYGVLAPVKRRLSLEEAAAWAARGGKAYDGDGRPALVVRGWRIERVFDRSQVELIAGHDPLPERPSWITQRGAGPDGLFDAVCGLITAAGFTIEHRPPTGQDGQAHGWTDYTRRVVWLRCDVDLAEQTRIACHELAHIRAGHEHRDDIGRAQRECEADSIAYVIAQVCGLHIEDSAARYVLSWSDGGGELIGVVAALVHNVACAILADLDLADLDDTDVAGEGS